MSRRKLVSFLLLLAVAIAVTSVSPVAPETEVGPALGYDGTLSDCDPENDAADYMNEALENEEALECEEDPEAEMAPDNTNWPLTGVDPRTDAANEAEEALENDNTETNFHFENEEAKDDVISPSDGVRIVNGIPASIRKYPYQVAIWFQKRFRVSGSIISDRWILTVAHGFGNLSLMPSLYSVTVGSDYANRGVRYNVSSIHIHPQYNRATVDFDVAVVSVASKVEFNDYVQRIPLTQKSYPRIGASAVASGWGILTTAGPFPNELQVVELTIIPLATCRKVIQLPLTDHELCAGNNPSHLERATCFGDSGGPLVSDGVQVGITCELRVPCGKYPSVFTNVYYALSWIKTVTGLRV